MLTEQVLVAGLGAGDMQGDALAAQPGLCAQAVPSEPPRAAKTDLPFK